MAPRIGEVVDHLRAEGSGQRAADGLEAHPQGTGLLPVDQQAQLRRFGQSFHHRVKEFRVGLDLAKKSIASLQQRFAADPATVHQAQCEAAGVTQTVDRWRRHGHDRAIVGQREMLVQRGDLGGGRLLGASLGPVLEGWEGQRGIVALAGEAEARDQEHRSHRLAGLEEALELLAGGIGAHARSARRQLHVDHHVAEVFRRHEGFRQAQVEVAEHGHQAGVHQHEASGARHQLRVEQRIALGDAGEATVEGAEEAALLVVPSGMGLSSVAHSAGVKVRARKPENRIETASDTENCW